MRIYTPIRPLPPLSLTLIFLPLPDTSPSPYFSPLSLYLIFLSPIPHRSPSLYYPFYNTHCDRKQNKINNKISGDYVFFSISVSNSIPCPCCYNLYLVFLLFSSNFLTPPNPNFPDHLNLGQVRFGKKQHCRFRTPQVYAFRAHCRDQA